MADILISFVPCHPFSNMYKHRPLIGSIRPKSKKLQKGPKSLLVFQVSISSIEHLVSSLVRLKTYPHIHPHLPTLLVSFAPTNPIILKALICSIFVTRVMVSLLS